MNVERDGAAKIMRIRHMVFLTQADVLDVCVVWDEL